MTISQNLLYLLLLYAVLDKGNNLTTINGILVALGIMLYGCCCGGNQIACPNRNRINDNTFTLANDLI